MNESSLLINSAFALRQQDSKPVYTLIGERIERPYTEVEIEILKESMKKIFARSRLSKEQIEQRMNWYEARWQTRNKKTDGKTNYPIDLNKLERIILTPKAHGYISTAFIDFAIANNIAIYWIDKEGIIISSFMPIYFKRASLIVKQCEARINGKNVDIAKYIIGLKFKSHGQDNLINNLDKAKSISDIMKIEGAVAKKDYSDWNIDKKWNWGGRKGRTTLNVNAIDPINSMLNLGYSLLSQRMSEILLKRGFELSIGFLHTNELSNRIYWNMLSADFIEPFRFFIDNAVKNMIAKNEIKPNDFIFSDNKMSLIFKDKAFDIALDEFLKVLNPLEYKSLPMIREIEKMLN